MIPLTDDQLRALQEKAEQATSGPWRFERDQSGRNHDEGAFLTPDNTCVMSFGDSEQWYPSEGQSPTEPDRNYIAACDPQTVLALVAELLKLREDVTRFSTLADERHDALFACHRDVDYLRRKLATGGV